MREGAIKYWTKEERPREKLLTRGKTALTNAELIAILIATGYKEKSALDVSYEILELAGGDLNELSRWDVQKFKQIKGIGDAKALLLIATFELARRRKIEDVKKVKLAGSKIAAKYISSMIGDELVEKFCIIYLNNAHNVIHYEVTSMGGITATTVDIRVILRNALYHLATSIIIGHNHPSGNLNPSKADKHLTNKLNAAAAIMDIKLLDHVIVTNSGFYSFADEGMII